MRGCAFGNCRVQAFISVIIPFSCSQCSNICSQDHAIAPLVDLLGQVSGLAVALCPGQEAPQQRICQDALLGVSAVGLAAPGAPTEVGHALKQRGQVVPCGGQISIGPDAIRGLCDYLEVVGRVVKGGRPHVEALAHKVLAAGQLGAIHAVLPVGQYDAPVERIEHPAGGIVLVEVP